MRLTLDCPNARYGPDMAIICARDGEPCAHQYFKSCKGWWALSPEAARCPIRKAGEHESEASPSDRHAL